MATTYYVYEHRRKDSGMVFYVGKGCGRRSMATNKRSAFWNNVVKKADGFTVTYPVQGVDEELAFLCEQEAIDKYRAMGIKLVNHTDGGEGSSGFKMSAETRQKMSASRVGEQNPNYGKTRPDHVKQAISEKRRGRLCGPDHPRYGQSVSDEMRQRISEKLKGATLTPEQKKKQSDALRKFQAERGWSRPVQRVDTGQIFKSVAEAARLTGLTRSSIRSVCDGKFKSTGGVVFQWSSK